MTPGYLAMFFLFLVLGGWEGVEGPANTRLISIGLPKVELTNKYTTQIQVKQEKHLLYSGFWKL